MNYDITFCSLKCKNTECKRNMANAPDDIPIWIAEFNECKKRIEEE